MGSTLDSMLRTWIIFHEAWRKEEIEQGNKIPLFPFTVEKIRNVAAMFKKDGYHGYTNYVN